MRTLTGTANIDATAPTGGSELTNQCTGTTNNAKHKNGAVAPMPIVVANSVFSENVFVIGCGILLGLQAERSLWDRVRPTWIIPTPVNWKTW